MVNQDLEKPIYPKDKVIMQANALTGSRHAFTASQLDIFFMLLAQLQPDDEPGKLYQVFISDIKAITGRDWQIVQLRDSITSLGSKPFEIVHDEDSGSIYWPFQQINYLKGKGMIEIKLADEMRPLLFHLKARFTVMQLKSVLSCTSKHAKRLYALACQWRVKGHVTFTLGELKEMMHLKEPGKKEKLERFDNFRNRVLDEGCRQINEFTDLTLSFDLIQKKGSKAFEAVTFHIGHHNPKQLEIDYNKSIQEQKHVNYIVGYGIGQAIAEKMAKHFDLFVQLKEQLIREITAGKEVKDRAAYLVKIFQNKKLL